MGSNHSKKFDKTNDTELTEYELNYLLKTTHFDRNEILMWHEGFLKDCPKGRIDRKQFIEVYKQFYPKGKADKFCGFLFKSFDTDSSGEIDFVEFMTAVSVTAKGDIREKLSLAFNMFDIDRNGSIERKEMEKIMDAIYDLLGEGNRKGDNSPAEKVKQIMQKIDVNHDGKLSSEEFIQGCMADESLRNLLAPYASSSSSLSS